MKRSRQIVLLLGGALAVGGLTACGPDEESQEVTVSDQNTYTNNTPVPGAGYYHAPYRRWYSLPYNYYDPQRGYYHGDQWTPKPHQSDVTESRPTPEAAQAASAKQSASQSTTHTSRTISRGGFGRSRFFSSS